MLPVPLIRKLLRPGNLVTTSGLLVLGCFLWLKGTGRNPGPWIMAALYFYGYALSDILDGAVSRWTGTNDRFGELYDLTADRIKDNALTFAVLMWAPAWAWYMLPFMVLKLAPEVLWSRTIGARNHKQAADTSFSRIYTLFHNYIVLVIYTGTKTAFFGMVLLGFDIPVIAYLFLGLITTRFLSVFEFLAHLARSE